MQVESWGGEVVSVEVSATKKQGINELLDMILLTADILDLKANPEQAARAVVLEARKEVGRGIVATVLVQDGTLKISDAFFSNTHVPASSGGQATDTPMRLTRRQNRIPMRTFWPDVNRTLCSGSRISTV